MLSFRRALVLCCLATTCSNHNKNQVRAASGKYYIQPDAVGDHYYAIGIDPSSGKTTRYPCEMQLTPVPILVCRKPDGTIIDHDEIDYTTSTSYNQAAPSSTTPTSDANAVVRRNTTTHTEDWSLPSSSPCKRTPDDFDGPGGILCPPSKQGTDTSNEEESQDDDDVPKSSLRTPISKPALIAIICICGVLLVLVVIGPISVRFLRNHCNAHDEKSVHTDCDDVESSTSDVGLEQV